MIYNLRPKYEKIFSIFNIIDGIYIPAYFRRWTCSRFRSGYGLSDWPKCFGRWIPPTSLSQLPDYIDPEEFNLVLAWVEYLNRLFGALVGLIILITFIIGYLHFKSSKKVLYSISGAFLLTLLEGWVGAKLVDTVLDPITITIHLLLALW